MKISSKQTWISGIMLTIANIIACIVGFHLSRHYKIIPDTLVHLPDIHVGHADMVQMISIFAVVFILQILLSHIINKSGFFINGKRFANEYFGFLNAYTVASLYVFLATTINYDPQFVATIGVLSTLFYLFLYLILAFSWQKQSVMVSLKIAIFSLMKKTVTFAGVFTLLFFLTPLILGKAFTSDRDIANQITQIRIWFNPEPESEWGLKNLYPGIKFAQPVLVTQSAGQLDALYVLERTGRVMKVSYPEDNEADVILDFSEKMDEIEMENGAVGLAFHPDFPVQPYVYIYYTDTRPANGQLNQLVRFNIELATLEERNKSETLIISMQREDDGFHNGGSVEFGPDRMLYVGLGEGVHPKGQELSSEVLRSGIIRIDVLNETNDSLPPQPFKYGELGNYRVPSDNPFIGRDDIRNEYWALGLRNPFRFNFDPVTEQLWVGDVGSTIWEEVNKIEKGGHYQFPVIEGYTTTGKSGWEALGLTEHPPIYTYQHSAYDRAIIGGVVARGDKYPTLKGLYIFADNYSSKVFAMPTDENKVENVNTVARANQYAQRGVSSVKQLQDGGLVFTTLGAASEHGGEVLLLVKAQDADADIVEDEGSKVPKNYDETITAPLFAVNCARCHGAVGKGDGPDSSMLGVPMPDLTSPMFHNGKSKEVLVSVIRDGGVQHGLSPMMPPWGGFLKDEEIEHLAIYLQSLPEKHHHH